MPDSHFKLTANYLVTPPTPTNIELHNMDLSLQCYPNPFKENAVISFNLKQSSDVNLAIYNLTGKQVLNITNQYFNIGSHEITFSSENLKPGVYLLKMNTQDNSEGIRLFIK